MEKVIEENIEALSVRVVKNISANILARDSHAATTRRSKPKLSEKAPDAEDSDEDSRRPDERWDGVQLTGVMRRILLTTVMMELRAGIQDAPLGRYFLMPELPSEKSVGRREESDYIEQQRVLEETIEFVAKSGQYLSSAEEGGSSGVDDVSAEPPVKKRKQATKQTVSRQAKRGAAPNGTGGMTQTARESRSQLLYRTLLLVSKAHFKI